MGVYIERDHDVEMYKDAYEEAQRIIRISDEVRITLETISPESPQAEREGQSKVEYSEKLTTSKVAKKLGIGTQGFLDKMVEAGYVVIDGDQQSLTPKGLDMGGESKSGRYGSCFIWPGDLQI